MLQSRISRFLARRAKFLPDEKMAMVRALHSQDYLSRLEDLLWLAEGLGLDSDQLAEATSPPPTTTNLPADDNRPYLVPASYEKLHRLLSGRPTAAQLHYSLRSREELHRTSVLALVGPPGSGKTTLLRHLGADYAIRNRFPTVLYANMAEETSALPTLHAWLASFDEPPAGLGMAQARLRYCIGRRRSLFLIDDLTDARLLPQLLVGGERGWAVVVCSRDVADEAFIPHQAVIPHIGWDGATACRYLEFLWGRELTDQERAWALEINDLVGGLVLAWTVLTPWLDDPSSWEEILDGLRSAPMEALNWSHSRLRTSLQLAYERLPAPAQILFQTMGAFAPGAPFDAEAVAAIWDVPLAEAKRSLTALNQASFLSMAPTLSSEPYRQMHRLLHHFAAELIASDPQREILAERHARFYAGRAYPLRQEQNSATWTKAVRSFLADLPNVRHGQAWTAERMHPLAVDYFLNVAPYQVAIRDDENLAWGRAALPVVEANPEALSALERLTFYGQLPDPDPAMERTYLERALRIAREEIAEDAEAYQVYALCWLARFLCSRAGQAMEAEPVLIEALGLAIEGGYPALETHVLCEVARFFLCIRDEAGLKVLAEQLPVDPPVMHAEGPSGSYYHGIRAEVLRQIGRWAEAEKAYDLVIGLRDEMGDRLHGASVRLRRAICRAELGHTEGSEQDLNWAREYLNELPPWVQMRYQWTLAQLDLVRGDADGAWAGLHALPEGWAEEPDLALDLWLAWHHVEKALGHLADSRAAAEKAKAVAESKGFVLQLDTGQRMDQARASAAPDLLSRVSGRPPFV